MHNNLSTVQGREKLFMRLYKRAFPAVARYIARRGGNLDEAQDIFQDALVIYYEKAVTADEQVIVNQEAFLLGVAKRLWLQNYRLNSKNELLDGFDVEARDGEAPATGKIWNYLQTAGKKCMELLKACYYDGLRPDNVATHFGYSSTHSATVAKYKCLEKVRETVKQNSLNYADFIE